MDHPFAPPRTPVDRDGSTPALRVARWRAQAGLTLLVLATSLATTTALGLAVAGLVRPHAVGLGGPIPPAILAACLVPWLVRILGLLEAVHGLRPRDTTSTDRLRVARARLTDGLALGTATLGLVVLGLWGAIP